MNVKILESKNENVKKYIYEDDKTILESVLYKYPTYDQRTVMCISTMSGCTMGCSFCGASNGLLKILSSEEIVYQVDRMFSDIPFLPNKIKNFQIMFMSMGEPLHNIDNVLDACILLNEIYPNAKLLISTSGPNNYSKYLELILMAEKIEQIGLQFSVHESINSKRRELINRDKILDLDEIGYIGRLFYQVTGRKPFFNYCVHDDNNSYEDVLRLKSCLNPEIFEATLSVICEKDETIKQSIDRQERLASDFSSLMLSEGYSTRVFNPAGQDDIGGGCGQLWQVQRKFKDMSKK